MNPIAEKFVVLGSGGVGKSATAIQFAYAHLYESQPDFDPTLEDSYRRQIDVDGKPMSLEILDTAGCSHEVATNRAVMQGVGFLLIYSITSRQSFEDLQEFKDKVLRDKDCDTYPMVLIGNKSDLDQVAREVPIEEGASLARSWGIPFLETSAKQRHNIEEAFAELVREFRSARARINVQNNIPVQNNRSGFLSRCSIL